MLKKFQPIATTPRTTSILTPGFSGDRGELNRLRLPGAHTKFSMNWLNQFPLPCEVSAVMSAYARLVAMTSCRGESVGFTYLVGSLTLDDYRTGSFFENAAKRFRLACGEGTG